MEDGGAEAEGENWDGLPPEVLEVIFQHLPVQDLLSCSIISKNWKKAARDVLKRNRECYAHVRYFHQDIQALNGMIASTQIMQMINGLRIRNKKRAEQEFGSDKWEDSRCSDVARFLQSEEVGRKLDEAKQKILGVLCGQWRYLDLDMGFGWRHPVSLDKGLLLREVILAASDSLQKLVIGQERDCQFIPCCEKPFLKLKVIQVQQELPWGCCLDSHLSSFAPNLNKITGAMIELDVRDPADGFKLERMKSVRFRGNLAVAEGEAREVFRCVSGLYRLDLQQYYSETYDDDDEIDELDLPSCRSFTFPFVLRSVNTLKELRMYFEELCNLSMAYSGITFPNLRRLSLATGGGWLISITNEVLTLKNLNLPKLCPNLEQLELMQSKNSLDVENDVVTGREPDGLDQSEMPIQIDWKCRFGIGNQDGLYKHAHLEFLHTIYPKLSKVRILKLKNVVDYDMSKIFWEVQSLEYLEIQVCRPPYQIEIGLEALLCGINIEEAKLPLLENQNKTEKLNSCIVPIRPSLLNARNLKELKITEDALTSERLLMVRRSWVAQITENLPERHARNMTVTFDGSKGLYDRMNNMRAFTWLRANKKRGKLLESSQYWIN